MNVFRGRDDAVSRALGALADDERTLAASAAVEARLIAEADAIASVRRRRVYAAAGALAAALLAALVVPLLRPGSLVAPGGDSGSAVSSEEIATEFFPLRYFNVPANGSHTIRLELPQDALTSFGLEPDNTRSTVVADVLVGQDGLARAVRFVRPSVTKDLSVIKEDKK